MGAQRIARRKRPAYHRQDFKRRRDIEHVVARDDTQPVVVESAQFHSRLPFFMSGEAYGTKTDRSSAPLFDNQRVFYYPGK